MAKARKISESTFLPVTARKIVIVVKNKMENIEFKCQTCDRTFSRKCDLTHHVKYGKHFNCLECGKIISSNKFCSRSCSATYNNRLRQVSEEQKLKTSKSLSSFYKERSLSKEHYYCKSCNKEIDKNLWNNYSHMEPELITRAEIKKKQMTDEMLGKLKDLGNSILGNFGISLDNFKMTPNGQGGYSIQYQNQNQNK